MSMAVKVKMLLAARQLSLTDLSKRLDPPTTVQNLSQKLKRDNLSESDLTAIAAACDATYEGTFILNDSGKTIR